MAISVSSRKDLETRILELEKIQARQVLELKRSAVDIVESLTPANIIKSALKNVAQSPDIRTSVINTAIGIGAGFLGNKLIVGKSSNIFKRILALHYNLELQILSGRKFLKYRKIITYRNKRPEHEKIRAVSPGKLKLFILYYCPDSLFNRPGLTPANVS